MAGLVQRFGVLVRQPEVGGADAQGAVPDHARARRRSALLLSGWTTLLSRQNGEEVILANYPYLAIVEVDRAISRHAAELRANHRLRPADALQVAACLAYGATAFLTNDKGLPRLTELQVVVLEDFVEG